MSMKYVYQEAGLRDQSDSLGYAYAPAMPDEEPGLLSKMLSPMSTAAHYMFTVPDAAARRTAGTVLGMGAKEDQPLGAPSGEQIWERVFGALPENQPGFQMRDIPGFATEMAVSPWNLIGMGALSKVGQAGARLSKLERTAKALKAGQQAVPDELASAISKLKASGVKPVGETLAEQGLRGERGALSLGLPFGKTQIPIGGRKLNQALLGAMGTTGRGIQRGYRGVLSPKLRSMFRTHGRLSPNLQAIRAAAKFSGRDYNAAVEAAQQVERAASGQAKEEAARTARYLEGLDVPKWEGIQEKIRKQLRPHIEEAKNADPTVARFTRQLDRAYDSGDAEKIARASARLDRAEDAALRKLHLTKGWESSDPRYTLMGLGLQTHRVGEKLTAEADHIYATYTKKIAANRERLAQVTDPKQAGHIRGKITRLETARTDYYVGLAAEKKLRESAFRMLPEDLQKEVGRIAALTDDALGFERQIGVRVSELNDAHLGYLYRTMTQEGLQFVRAMQELGLEDSPFLAFFRQIQPNTNFTRRRTDAFQGMTITQINDEARRFAEQYKELFASKGYKPFTGQFFVEDPSEILLRRLTASGKAREAATMHRSVIEMFSVPARAAKTGDKTVAKYLEEAGIGAIDDAVLPRSEAGIRAVLQDTKYADKVIPNEFASAALRTSRAMGSPSELAEFGSWFDRYSAMMRFYVTVPFPGYHARNEMSNAFMMFLAGMRNPGHLWTAMTKQRMVQKALKNPGKYTEGPIANALNEYHRMVELGAIGETMTAELKALSQAAGKPKSRVGKALGGVAAPAYSRAGSVAMTAAQGIENNAKWALWLHAKGKGLTDHEAADMVKKWLFNYGDLSPFEKKYVRRWAFFWTFQRKAMPRMVEALVRNPKTMRAYLTLTGRIGSDSAQQELLPEHKLERDMFGPLAGEGDKRQFFSLGLPPEELSTLSAEGRPGALGALRIGQKVASQLVPSLRIPMEAISGTSLSTGYPANIGRLALGLTPASRFVTTKRNIEQVASGERGPMQLLRLAGISPTEETPRKARLRKKLQHINYLLENAALSGKARKFPVYRQAYGQKRPEIDLWNKLRRRLQQQISNLP